MSTSRLSESDVVFGLFFLACWPLLSSFLPHHQSSLSSLVVCVTRNRASQSVRQTSRRRLISTRTTYDTRPAFVSAHTHAYDAIVCAWAESLRHRYFLCGGKSSCSLTTHHQPKCSTTCFGCLQLLLRNETALVLCRQHNEIVGQREPVAILPLPRATTTYNSPEEMAFNEDSSASGHDEPWIQW